MIITRTIVSGITGHFRTRLSEWLVSGLLAAPVLSTAASRLHWR